LAEFTIMNVIEISVTGGDYVVIPYVRIDAINRLGNDEKNDLKIWLRAKDLPYYWTTQKYLECEPGLYVFSENGELELPHFSSSDLSTIKLKPSSYAIKFLLKALVDRNLRKNLKDKVERLAEDMGGNIVYRLKDPLFSWPSSEEVLYELYRRVSFRIEHVRHFVGYKPSGEPIHIDKLYLLPTMDLQIITRTSLGEIVTHIGDKNLLSWLLYKRVFVKKDNERKVGLLVDTSVERNFATIQMGEEKIELPLNNVYLETNPTWYRDFLREISMFYDSSYDELLDKLGVMTYRFEPVIHGLKRRRKIISNAPTRYLKDLEVIVDEIIAKAFPIRFQEVEYGLCKVFTQIERGE